MSIDVLWQNPCANFFRYQGNNPRCWGRTLLVKGRGKVSIIPEDKGGERIDASFKPKTLSELRRILIRKKEDAKNRGLPEPTMALVLEMLVIRGILSDDLDNRTRDEERRRLEELRTRDQILQRTK